MSQQVLLQPSFVLHTRPYRETSLLVTLFSRDYGRVDAICRGVRKLKSPLKGLLQPFHDLQVSWAGRGDLVTIKDAELVGALANIAQQPLLIGLYLNELLIRLLAPHDPHENLFGHYQALIQQLATAQPSEQQLRQFEKQLLSELGFGLNLELDVHGQPIQQQQHYQYHPEQGFFLTPAPNQQGGVVFLGENLLAIANNSFNESQICRDAKRLMRLALNHMLQYKPLRVREVFYREEMMQ